MLTDERILCISMSRKVEAGLLETETFVLERDDDESEAELLVKLDEHLRSIKPIGVVGFANRGYDLPLLAIKLHHHETHLLHIGDTLRRALHLDVREIAREYLWLRHSREPTYYGLTLSYLASHQAFSHLSLKKTELEIPSGADKGSAILELWNNDRRKLEAYSKEDAEIPLLLAEYILNQL